MRIAAYYPWVYLKSGVERTILELSRRSAHHYTVFTNHYDAANTYPGFEDLNVVKLRQVPVQRNIGSVLKAAAVIGLQKLDLRRFDALLVHCDGLGDLILNRASSIPAACFCHTPLRPVFDPDYRERALANYTGTRRIAFNALSRGFRSVDREMWSRYSHVFFNSRETLTRAERGGLLHRFKGTYEILHPGISWNACQPSWRYDKYFLVVGRIMWTKNIETALAAFIRFKDASTEFSEFRLVLAGHVDKKSEVYFESLTRMCAGRDDIQFIISPTDETIRGLYRDAYAVLFPAFNEDWGIVPLEANAFGKPVIAVNCGGPTESQLDGETGFLVSAHADAFAAAMKRLAADEGLVRRMGHTAREHARAYDWSTFVSRADSVMEELCQQR